MPPRRLLLPLSAPKNAAGGTERGFERRQGGSAHWTLFAELHMSIMHQTSWQDRMIAGRSPAEYRKFTAFKKNNIKLPPYTYKNSTEKAGSRLDRHIAIRVLITEKKSSCFRPYYFIRSVSLLCLSQICPKGDLVICHFWHVGMPFLLMFM